MVAAAKSYAEIAMVSTVWVRLFEPRARAMFTNFLFDQKVQLIYSAKFFMHQWS